MADLIRVKSGYPDSRVAFWEKHPDHANGEVFVAGAKEADAAKTRAVEKALKSGALVEVTAAVAPAAETTGNEPPADEPSTETEPTATELPADFPARQALVDSGMDTLEKVRAASDEDLDAIQGVGAATIKSIREAS